MLNANAGLPTHIDYAIDKIIAQDGKTGKHDTVWLNREVMGL